MKKTSFWFWTLLVIGWQLGSVQLAYAQTTTSQTGNVASDSEDETLDVPRGRRFVYLTLGIEYDEKVTNLPDVVSFKGDFKKVTAAALNKDGNSVHFIPKSEGVATLTLHDKAGKKLTEFRLIVRKSRLDAVARELQSLLGEVEGITIRIINNKVIVDGQVLLPSDMARIVNVIAQFGDQASSIVTMSPTAMKKIAELIAREVNNPEIEIKALNDKIILQGMAASEEEKRNAEYIAKSYMPPLVTDSKEVQEKVLRRRPANDGVVNLIQVKPQAAPPPPKMVQVVLHYVELSKDYSKSFRFQFMPTIGDDSGIQVTAGDTGSGFGTQFTATIKSLVPKLNWMKSHGHARVLESGSIMVKDGSAGHFESKTTMGASAITSGGQAVNGSGGQVVGIITDVTPTTSGERSDSVDMVLKFWVGAPAGRNGNELNVASNTINTNLVVRSTQSAAVGGLITNSAVTSYNKLPADVSNNPIISLYASKDFTHGQSQFVVFVTPIVRSSASAGAEKIKKKFRLTE
jgi:pilus assembly protein CpaC